MRGGAACAHQSVASFQQLYSAYCLLDIVTSSGVFLASSVIMRGKTESSGEDLEMHDWQYRLLISLALALQIHTFAWWTCMPSPCPTILRNS